jgi:hypothetical protein
MVIAELERALSLVSASFDEVVDRLEPLVKSIIKPPELFLSSVLLGTMMLGNDRQETEAVAAARALEFLEQALKLGAGSGSADEIESDLLMTDYLYAQAIDQVVEIDRPAIIGALAGAIMATAQDRAAGAERDHRTRLVVAALEIGSRLGRVAGSAAEDIEAVKLSIKRSANGWLDRFPAGPVKDRLVEARPAVNDA